MQSGLCVATAARVHSYAMMAACVRVCVRACIQGTLACDLPFGARFVWMAELMFGGDACRIARYSCSNSLADLSLPCIVFAVVTPLAAADLQHKTFCLPATSLRIT